MLGYYTLTLQQGLSVTFKCFLNNCLQTHFSKVKRSWSVNGWTVRWQRQFRVPLIRLLKKGGCVTDVGAAHPLTWREEAQLLMKRTTWSYWKQTVLWMSKSITAHTLWRILCDGPWPCTFTCDLWLNLSYSIIVVFTIIASNLNLESEVDIQNSFTQGETIINVNNTFSL